MPRRIQASNSFTYDEVNQLLELHRRLLRRGDTQALATCEPVLAVVRKFQRMAETLEAQRAERAERRLS